MLYIHLQQVIITTYFISAHEDMRRMIALRSQLGDIHHVLDVISDDTNGTTSLGKIS